MKIAQLETTFRDRALQWYMKYKVSIPANQARNLDDIRIDLIQYFLKPKTEQQCIVELKDIKQDVG